MLICLRKVQYPASHLRAPGDEVGSHLMIVERLAALKAPSEHASRTAEEASGIERCFGGSGRSVCMRLFGVLSGHRRRGRNGSPVLFMPRRTFLSPLPHRPVPCRVILLIGLIVTGELVGCA